MSNLQRRTNQCLIIERWLRTSGLKVTDKLVSDLTSEFLKFKGLPYKEFNPRYKGLFHAGISNASTVLSHFEEFKTFVLTKINNHENT